MENTYSLPKQKGYLEALDEMSFGLEKLSLQLVTRYPQIAQTIVDIGQKFKQVFIPLNVGMEFSGRVKETVDKLRRRFNREIGRLPQRLDSPIPNDKFQAVIETGEDSPYKKALHYIIGCSNFDNRDRVNRFTRKMTAAERGTALTLESLTPDSIDGCTFRIKVIDDQYENIPYQEIINQAKTKGKKIIVSLAGIQTNQYPRALHIAAKIRAEAIRQGVDDKIDILFGGYHIRGHEESCQEVIQAGFTAVRGEAEDGRLGQILTDCVHDRRKEKYEWKDDEGNDKTVTLMGNPLMKPMVKYIEQFSPYQSVILQFSRGCPYKCKFCTVRKIDGQIVRPRSHEEVKILLEHMAKEGIKKIFIGDDNFYRNPEKMEILDIFIELKKKGINFSVMIQSDIKVTKRKSNEGEKAVDTIDKEFMDKCKEAGVDVVFLGTESFDFEVLKSMGKFQNIKGGEEEFIEKMRAQREAWNERGVSVNFTCIIGNEEDRKGVGKRSAEVALKIGVNILIPFIYTVFPGSDDYHCAEKQLKILGTDANFNKYSAGIPTVTYRDPDSLSLEEVKQEYRDLINTFYRIENLPKVCDSLTSLRHFLWYMLLAKIGHDRIMDRGFGKVIFAEKFNQTEHERDLTLCRKNI